MKEKNVSIVAIMSCGHSGSTLLDLLLGVHPKIVGLGELANSLNKKSKNLINTTCSCGERITNCNFWSKIIKNYTDFDNLSKEKKYEIITKTFSSTFEQDTLLVDSSKSIPHLQFLLQNDYNVKVLFLIKDVRNYTISVIDKANKTNEKKSAFQTTGIWYHINKNILKFLYSKKVDFCQIGYEEICLYPDLALNKIYDFLNLKFSDELINLNSSKSHIVTGNRMRNQKEKKIIRYDNRWMTRNEWLLPLMIRPHILQFSNNKVYSNNFTNLWNL